MWYLFFRIITQVVANGQSSKFCSTNAAVPDHMIFSLLDIFTDHTTLYSCLNKPSGKNGKLDTASLLEDGLWTITECGAKWLVYFISTNIKVSFNYYHNPYLPDISRKFLLPSVWSYFLKDFSKHWQICIMNVGSPLSFIKVSYSQDYSVLI